MKLSLLIKKMGISAILSFCFFDFAWGETLPDTLDHHTVRKVLADHLGNYPDLLDSSKDKDIVVFLGNTGAGKSTLINYLSNKKLQVNTLGDIVLENPGDASAMAIGGGSNSQTFLPSYIQSGNLLLYDLPGFMDTRGTAQSLINACFIKNIIEKARSTKLVFVGDIGQITTDRGASFKTLLSQTRKLIPNSKAPLETFSSLVITKSYLPKAGLPDFVRAKIDLKDPDFDLFEALIKRNMVEQMSRPTNNAIDSQDRNDILAMISRMGQQKIDNIDTSVIYDNNQQTKIREIYEAEIDNNIEKLVVDVAQLPSLDKAGLKAKKDFMLKNFESQVEAAVKVSPLIVLLRPISEPLYQTSWKDRKQKLVSRRDIIVSQIDIAIKDKEKQEEERLRIQAEEALRQAQLREREERERAYRAEQELNAYREAERQRQLEAQRQQEEIKKRQATSSSQNLTPQSVVSNSIYDKLSCYDSWKKCVEERERVIDIARVCGRTIPAPDPSYSSEKGCKMNKEEKDLYYAINCLEANRAYMERAKKAVVEEMLKYRQERGVPHPRQNEFM
jgi:ribosome biogenesis GTPase A